MKNWTRRAGALALALGLSLSLAACGGDSAISKFDAVAYVDGLLKENYLGEFDPDYLDLVAITEAEAKATYESGLDVEVDYFLYYYDIEYPTDEFREEVWDLYADIYSHAKFEVISAAQQDDGSYSVKVKVEPIDIIKLVEADFEDGMAPFYEDYPTEVQDAMTDEEYEAMDQVWAGLVLDVFEENMPDIGNLAPQEIVVQLEQDEDGYYSLTEEDFGRLDDLIIDYGMDDEGASV